MAGGTDMAGGAADDDKTTHVDTTHVDASRPVTSEIADHAPAPPRAPETPAMAEWTASDRRGPLASSGAGSPASAPDDDDVERIVPGSEIDAEGAHDTPAAVHSETGALASTLADAPHEAGTTAEADAEPVAEAGALPGHPDTPPASAPYVATDPVQPAPAKRSFVPLAAGIVVGALIGAGSAAAVYAMYGGSGAVDPDKFAAVSARIDALDKRPDPQATMTALKSQVDELAGKVAALDKRVGIAPASGAASSSPQGSASSGASKPAASGPSASASAPAAVDPALIAKIAAIQSGLEALQKQSATTADALKGQQQTLDGKIGALQTAVGSAQKQASAAQSGVESVQTEQKSLAGKLGAPALAVVADSLVGQVTSGKPYATQVDALTSLGADPVKVVVLRQKAATGVASAQALLAAFKPLVDPIVATGNTVPANANFGDKLKHGLFGLVSVKRTDVTTGNDLPSRVALIQADLTHDDVPGAFAVWSAMPADAKQVSAAWGASAKSSAEAITAGRALQADSINSLAARKS